MPNTSYYLYQKWEQRGEQDWIPAFPNTYSIDGDGTMPLSAKTINDPACGYIPPSEPIYRWVNLDPSIDWVCDETPVSPTNVITYEATDKLIETTILEDAGLHKNGFSGVNGKLTMTNHTFENGVGYIEFNDGVTSIDSNAFLDCSSLISVVIPDSVTTIGWSAFDGCTSLASINIPNMVTIIDINAFRGCSGLTSIVIPNSVTNIGGQAFSGCSSLTNIIIPSGVTTINNNTFCKCSSLSSITIPDSVTVIGDYAFELCTSLASITIPSGVTSIGDGVLLNCSGLTSIICLATTAPTITKYTFRNVKTGGTLFVPQGSTGYDTWMSTSNYYLGLYNWTKVELSNS